ncbi:large conductance mechanosensitive channel [Actinocorallia herbida]|uniref:Large conductance mechanosensitive channel n=1 Tax=Actinocorallia herbida TaxID=58109 RepID=A0A3N1CSE5_9ACTN|nr:MscL family protein [Actinocorallia herbida]ROO84227.1 large conductance mechanosensitive channel [Actinocorallia herbida]
MEGLKKFLLRGNLVQLAVAVVVGAQFSGLVTQFVKSFIDPLLALVGGNPNLDFLVFTIGDTKFPYGTFLSVAITFAITATVIYFVLVAPMAKLLVFLDRKEAATERDCPSCLSAVPVKASRCKFCTSELQPVA